MLIAQKNLYFKCFSLMHFGGKIDCRKDSWRERKELFYANIGRKSLYENPLLAGNIYSYCTFDFLLRCSFYKKGRGSGRRAAMVFHEGRINTGMLL